MEKHVGAVKRNCAPLTQQTLQKLFTYDPDTGEFWRRSKYRGRTVRKKAGYLFGGPKGYYKICINGQYHMCHRLVWLYAFGCWPTNFIDHINRDRLDNRLCNLREANRSQNAGNANLSRRNKSGFKGVFKRGNRWLAVVRGKKIGSFSSPQEASHAHNCEHARVFGEFSSEAGNG